MISIPEEYRSGAQTVNDSWLFEVKKFEEIDSLIRLYQFRYEAGDPSSLNNFFHQVKIFWEELKPILRDGQHDQGGIKEVDYNAAIIEKRLKYWKGQKYIADDGLIRRVYKFKNDVFLFHQKSGLRLKINWLIPKKDLSRRAIRE